MVDGDWRGEKFSFINVYAPAAIARRKYLFLGLEQVCTTSRGVVLGGGTLMFLFEAPDFITVHLKGVVKRYSLKEGCVAGVYLGEQPGVRSRLDHVFVPGGLRVAAAEVVPLYFSDHSGLAVTVGWDAPAFGRGCWRMNTQVLEEEAAYRVRFVEDYKGWTNLKPFFASAVDW